MSEQKKVLFVQGNDEGGYETESLWCDIADDNFVIDNIPFIAKRISVGDVIKAEYDNDDKQYYFDDFVAVSGNTTVRIFFENSNLIEATRGVLEGFGCDSEVLLQRKVVAVNIPKSLNYKPVKDFLDEGESGGDWVYEESCLAHDPYDLK